MLRDFVVIDLETTGLSILTDEIVEVAGIKVKDYKIVDTYAKCIKPKKYIPLSIQKMIGIPYEKFEEAESKEVILPEFYKFLEDLPLVGHNINNFDFDMLQENGKSLGLDFSLNYSRRTIDTLVSSRIHLPDMHHKLQDMAEYYRIEIDTASFHEALYDSYVTYHLYECLDRDFGKFPDLFEPSRIKQPTEGGRVKNTDSLFD